MSSSSRIKVLGIDPGIGVTGYGLVLLEEGKMRALDWGVWRQSARLSQGERLRRLFDSISSFIGSQLASAEAMELAVEDFYVGHVRAAVTIGQARAMALLAAAQADIESFLYRPLEVKQFVTSYGRGDKRQVQEMVRALLRLELLPGPADAADALAVAICHCLRRETAAVLERHGGQA
ncbi:MAG TPA: crossover junction endodeoxyribonuclease RuvC, partial [Dehalococcoidia bacterium]|nr:crossover junction endodeoxyribonuclease RuvC [Dehalococcoidia bacterium]